jgi:amino acid transporter
MLPAAFGKIHPKYQTPHVAIIFVGVLVCLAVFLGRSALVWLIDAAALGTVVAYFLVSLSFIILRVKEPELDRPYKVRAGMLVGILAVGVALFFLWLYLPFGPAALLPVEWSLVLGWVVLGLIFYIRVKGKYRGVTPAEYEYLMFGEEYARKSITK